MQKEQTTNALIDFRSKSSTLISLIKLFFLATGFYGSLKVVLSLFGIEGDTCHSLMLWIGVKEHGIKWISDWIFTQDNWLLSLTPLHFILFSIFGPSPSSVLIFGWLIFISSALVAGAIAWSVGAKKGSFYVLTTILNMGYYAHEHGKVAYSTSHNITNLFGLTSILIVINWSLRPNDSLLALLLLLLTCGATSDPWMLPAYNLPILLVGLIFLARPTKTIGTTLSLKLIMLCIFSILTAKTKLYGILSFLPNISFSIANCKTSISNIFYLVKDLGGLLNIFPYSGYNEFTPSLISLVSWFALLLSSIVIFFKTRTSTNQGVVTYLLVTMFSVLGIISAFVINNLRADDSSARFLINNAYLIIISAGVFADFIWKNVRISYRYFIAIIFCLFITTGLIGNFNCITNSNYSFRDNGISNTISFLKENSLTYGYGPYWGANTNAVTAVSKGDVRIRPVLFDKESGMIAINRVESSKRWYTSEDIPQGVNDFFVIIKSDGEECPDTSVCLNGLIKQFGQPIRSVTRNDSTVLVWNHKLLNN